MRGEPFKVQVAINEKDLGPTVGHKLCQGNVIMVKNLYYKRMKREPKVHVESVHLNSYTAFGWSFNKFPIRRVKKRKAEGEKFAPEASLNPPRR